MFGTIILDIPPSSSVFQKMTATLPLHGKTSLPFREFCRIGKSCKLSFSSSETITTSPLEVVHSDVWDPSPILSVCGFCYYVVFVDDYSKYTWMSPIHCKLNVYSVFLTFKLQAENLLSSKIKHLRSDGGGEYLRAKFQNFLRDNGIIHQIWCRYTPEQNGRAERKHRHIVETGLNLHFTAQMPLNYWADAFSTATYLINRMPMRSLNFISPWQKLFHHSPIYTNLKVFGCSCYPLLRPYTKHILEPKTKKKVSLLAIAWTTRVIDVWIQLLEKHFFLDMLCLMKNPFHSSPLH